MAQRVRPTSPAAIGAIALLAFGVLFAVLYVIANRNENHSFNSDPTPPAQVKITIGQQYEISIPGGVDELRKRGIDPGALNCSYTSAADQTSQRLDTTALGDDTRTTHAVATFNAPVSGLVHIECAALTKTFVDDADNGRADPAGLFILLCTISLTAAAALGLSVLYGRPSDRDRPIGPIEPVDDDGYDQLLAPAPAPWIPRARDVNSDTGSARPTGYGDSGTA